MRTLGRSDKPSAFDVRLILLTSQLVATLMVLALVAGNVNKLIGFAVVWSVTFRWFSLRELLWYLGACTLFSIMDIMSVRQGVFGFSQPDLAGLPVWEFFMWGFLVLHILRMLNGPVPKSNLRLVLPLTIVFALPFSTIADPTLLLAGSGGALALALFFFHERWDWIYVGYALVLGVMFEYVGVWSGQWVYPGNVPGGVPIWFMTMWGGIGLFTRRLVLPTMSGPPKKLDLNSGPSR
jgi:hypothetical protein